MQVKRRRELCGGYRTDVLHPAFNDVVNGVGMSGSFFLYIRKLRFESRPRKRGAERLRLLDQQPEAIVADLGANGAT